MGRARGWVSRSAGAEAGDAKAGGGAHSPTSPPGGDAPSPHPSQDGPGKGGGGSSTTPSAAGAAAALGSRAGAMDKVAPTFLLAIALNQFYMSSTILLPRAVSVYMVRRFLGPGREAEVAARTGTLSAVFSVVQLTVSFGWGWVTDYAGRKPILLLSNLASGVLVSGFVLANDYKTALALRTVGGLFFCSGLVIKSSIGDECTAKGQARAMAARALGLGVAQLVTPLVVGALADPCNDADSGGPSFGFRGTPACTPGGWLVVSPYALTAIFIGAVGVVTTASNWWFLPTRVENSPTRVAGRVAARARLARGWVAALTCGRVRLAGPEVPAATTSEGVSRGGEEGPAPAPKGGHAGAMAAVSEEEEEAGEEAVVAGPPLAARPPPTARMSVVLSPFAAAAAADPPQAGGGAAGGPSAASAGGAPSPLRRFLTAPAAVGRGRTAGASPPPPSPRPAPPEPPKRLTNSPSARLAAVFAATSTRANRLGRSLTASPSFARAVSNTNAILAAAAMTMNDMGGAVAAPGGGELDDLNYAAEAAARFRLTRTATLAGAATAPFLGRPPSAATPRPPLPPGDGADPEAAAPPAPAPWYRHRPALLAIAAYAVSAAVFCIVDELLPLYASAPTSSHGLGLTTQQLSWAMSAAGVFLILTASFLYPPLQDKLGLSGVLSWGLVAGIFMCVPAYPLAFRVSYATTRAGWSPTHTLIAVQAVLWVAGFLYAASYNMTGTSTQILVNLAAPDGAVGAVNGAGNTLSALARVFGPLLAAGMWGAASDSDSSLPKQWLPYLVAGSVFLLGRVAMAALRVTDERMLGLE